MCSSIKSKELYPIVCLSICFMLIFAADSAMLNMQKTLVSSIVEDQPDFQFEGYTMVGVLYTMFAISVWFGSYVNYALGSKLTMVLSSIGYLCYISSNITENQWIMGAGVVITGVAAGTLWPAQGSYMIDNSSPETTSRNVDVFWFIYNCSNVVGNIFVYFIFYGKKYIDKPTRRTAVSTLTAIGVVAVFSFMLIPKSRSKQTKQEYGPIKTIKKSFGILISPRMLWMTLAFSYAGLQQSFFQGIYSPCIGFTLAFGDSAKQYLALSGISMSFGSVLGSLGPIIFAGYIRKNIFIRKLIVIVGVVAQLVSYLTTFINLPNNSVFGNTEDISLIQPSPTLAILGSLLLSFGDSCMATQIYTFIGDFYRENSAETCALYKFVKGVLVAASFYLCNHLGLHTQVTILSVTAIVGCVGFCMADRPDRKADMEMANDTLQRKGCLYSSLTQMNTDDSQK